MKAVKYIGTFLGGFVCAALLFIFLIMPRDNQAGFEYGFQNGVIQGHLDAVDAIQKEFGTCDSQIAGTRLFGAYTSDVVSIETNGVKTIRVIP